MSGNLGIYTDLAAKLRSETTLVTLTGYSSTNLTIGRLLPIKKGQAPFLGIAIMGQTPLTVELPGKTKGLIEFTCCGRSQKDCTQLCDAVYSLFSAAMTDNVSYYDFSGDNVKINSALFSSRTKQSYDKDVEVYIERLYIQFICSMTPCGV